MLRKLVDRECTLLKSAVNVFMLLKSAVNVCTPLLKSADFARTVDLISADSACIL